MERFLAVHDSRLATPQSCRECVQSRQNHSGGLHQADRALAGFDHPDYPERLLRTFAEAEAALVVNPLIEAMMSPFCRRVHVVPSGFDPERVSLAK